MKLLDILKQINEDISKDILGDEPDENIFNSPRGYVVTKRETDPETGRSSTELAPEPQLLRYAKDLRRMKKDMKYFSMLPDDEEYSHVKSEAASILTSLNNAEGKMRDLYEKIKWLNRIRH